MVEAPVLVVGFRRPERMARVLETLSEIYSGDLWVFVDGPRVREEEELVEQVRFLARAHVVNPLRLNLQPGNLGCRRGVTLAIDWFFSHVTEGFILEDDCIPSSDFFRLGNFILETYREDAKVMQFSGRMPLSDWAVPNSVKRVGFGFDRVGSTWGWATWGSAWASFDRDLQLAPDGSDLLLRGPISRSDRVRSIRQGYEEVLKGTLSTWDYPWALTKLVHSGLTVVPSTNLIENIGFGPNATHTLAKPRLLNNKIGSLGEITLKKVPPVADAKLEVYLDTRHRLSRVTSRGFKLAKRRRERWRKLWLRVTRLARPE